MVVEIKEVGIPLSVSVAVVDIGIGELVFG